jgi:hypothetical protein
MLYDYQNKNTPVLTSVINENLQKAVGICNDIIYREKLNNFNIKIPTEEYVYLCSWNEVIDREKDNLVTFLNEVMDVYIEKVQLTMSQNKTVISGKCINDYTGIIFDLRLILNYTRDRADLIVYDKNGFEAKQQLTVKSNNNDYLLYFGKSEIKILKEKGITLDWWHF